MPDEIVDERELALGGGGMQGEAENLRKTNRRSEDDGVSAVVAG